jgi:hypothetical protein
VHVVEVTENNRVFVKSIEVPHCKNLAEHTITLTSQFRGRLDVTRERAYTTRQRLLHDELANLSPSTGSSRVTRKRKAHYGDELSLPETNGCVRGGLMRNVWRGGGTDFRKPERPRRVLLLPGLQAILHLTMSRQSSSSFPKTSL